MIVPQEHLSLGHLNGEVLYVLILLSLGGTIITFFNCLKKGVKRAFSDKEYEGL